MDPKDFARQLERLGALDEPVRRRLYLFVSGRGTEVSRDQAARAAGVTRALAAFHLDKLVEAGLLETSFRRLTGRGGPGAGRPAKLYRRSSVQLDVSLPERRYEWAAQVLARALSETDSQPAHDALRTAAHAHGERIGRELGTGARRATELRTAAHALERCGFEPQQAPEGQIVLRNCPFDSLRTGCGNVVCAMNLALVEGVVDGLSLAHVRATLEPGPDHCCVALRTVEPAAPEPADPPPPPPGA